jgi:hypothetical protein
MHGKKVHERRGGMDPLILDMSTIWRLMVSLKPRSLYTVKRAHPLNRRLEGRKGGLDALGKAKCIAPFWNRATIQPVAKSQYPLRYPGSPSFNVLV